MDADYLEQAKDTLSRANRVLKEIADKYGMPIVIPVLMVGIQSLRGGFDSDEDPQIRQLADDGVRRMQEGMTMFIQAMANAVNRDYPDVSFEQFAADHGLVLQDGGVVRGDPLKK